MENRFNPSKVGFLSCLNLDWLSRTKLYGFLSFFLFPHILPNICSVLQEFFFDYQFLEQVEDRLEKAVTLLSFFKLRFLIFSHRPFVKFFMLSTQYWQHLFVLQFSYTLPFVELCPIDWGSFCLHVDGVWLEN